MLIDWFTVGAQVVNFLVLVWLLKAFLYRPLLAAIDKREKGIRESLESADRKETMAKQAQAEFEEKNAGFARQQQFYLDEARRSAEGEKLRLVETARTQTENLQARWREDLAAEQEALRTDLARKAQEEIVSIARQALLGLAGTELEERMAYRFMEAIQQLDEKERERFAKAAQETERAVMLVESSKPLPLAVRQQIQKAIAAMLGSEYPLSFETNATLVDGIVLTLNGYRLSWTLQEYLDALQELAAKHLAANQKERKNG